jgi:nucleoredoxin
MSTGVEILRSGGALIDAKGGSVDVAKVLSAAAGTGEAGSSSAGYIGLYFSAHWCPPCRGFTPQLAQTYKALQANGTKFEIIFCSWDEDRKEFLEYAQTMPWTKLPFQDPRIQALSKLYAVQSIPTLIMLDAKSGAVFSTHARNVIPGDREGKLFPWPGGAANRPAPFSGRVLALGAMAAFSAFWLYDKWSRGKL